ncbi:hypothetical protein JZO77_14165 [Enterococcus hulanensis]|uniref:hypothetical protein n=1 Tax=Enterococcus hulanensis TaxID=2559929 RepID=UPI001A9094C0|nr:hypothetical protein [Enterococcus hulanensis]MBO0457880.1 hypothetical protein [Enterococcus hulanensis]
MMILILLILMIAMFISVRRKQKVQAQARYWERINEFEAQRKEQILATAIKLERRKTADSSIEKKWQWAS